MTNPHDKAIEAAAESIRKCLEAIGAEAGTNTCHAIAQDAIAAYERAMWRPIEEFDGDEDDEFLGCHPLWPKTYLVRYDRDNWYTSDNNIDGGWLLLADAPTHFRPLPKPEGE